MTRLDGLIADTMARVARRPVERAA